MLTKNNNKRRKSDVNTQQLGVRIRTNDTNWFTFIQYIHSFILIHSHIPSSQLLFEDDAEEIIILWFLSSYLLLSIALYVISILLAIWLQFQ